MVSRYINPIAKLYLCILLIMVFYVFLVFQTDFIMDFNGDADRVMISYKASIQQSKDETYQTLSTINENVATQQSVANITLEDVKFNEGYSQLAQDIMIEGLKYIQKYQSDEQMGTEDWSIFYQVAMSISEFGGQTDGKYSFYPVMPLEKMKEGQITVQAVSELNYGDYVKLGAYNSGMKYRGPLQMSPTWGTGKAMVPNDLSTKSEARLCDELGISAPANTRTEAIGDRCNWPDCCNLFGGVYKSYIKDLERCGYSSEYELLALISLGHNVGEAVIKNTGSESKLKQPIPKQSKFIWKNYEECRNWLKGFSKPETIEKIRTDVRNWLKKKRDKGTIAIDAYSFRDEMNPNNKYAKELMNGGYLGNVAPSSDSGAYWEAINYAIFTVCFYIIAQEVCSGV